MCFAGVVHTYCLSAFRVFAAGGAGDLLWHTLVGIEQSVEALYSPSHLILGVGSALIMSGPWRAAWKRPTRASPARWGEVLPMLLSLTFTLSGFTVRWGLKGAWSGCAGRGTRT